MNKLNLKFKSQELENIFRDQEQYQNQKFILMFYLLYIGIFIYNIANSIQHNQDNFEVALIINILLLTIYIISYYLIYIKHQNTDIINSILSVVITFILVFQQEKGQIHYEDTKLSSNIIRFLDLFEEPQKYMLISLLSYINISTSSFIQYFVNFSINFILIFFGIISSQQSTVIKMSFAVLYFIILVKKFIDFKSYKLMYQETIKGQVSKQIYEYIMSQTELNILIVGFNQRYQNFDFEMSSQVFKKSYQIKNDESMRDFIQNTFCNINLSPKTNTNSSLTETKKSNLKQGKQNSSQGILKNKGQSSTTPELKTSIKAKQNSQGSQPPNYTSEKQVIQITTNQSQMSIQQIEDIQKRDTPTFSKSQSQSQTKNQFNFNQNKKIDLQYTKSLAYVKTQNDVEQQPQSAGLMRNQQKKQTQAQIKKSEVTLSQVLYKKLELLSSMFNKKNTKKRDVVKIKKDSYKCFYKKGAKTQLNIDIFQYQQNPFIKDDLQFCFIVKEVSAEKQLDNLKKKSERDKQILQQNLSLMLHKMRKSMMVGQNTDMAKRAHILSSHKCPLILDKLKNIYHFYYLLRIKHIGAIKNFHIEQLYNNILHKLEYKLKQKQMQLIINIDPGIDQEVNQDYDMLELFSSNILRNAISNSIEGTNIVVQVEDYKDNTFKVAISNFCENYQQNRTMSQINTTNINYLLNSVYQQQSVVQMGLIICQDIVTKLGPSEVIEVEYDKEEQVITFSTLFYKNINTIKTVYETQINNNFSKSTSLRQKNQTLASKNMNVDSYSPVVNDKLKAISFDKNTDLLKSLCLSPQQIEKKQQLDQKIRKTATTQVGQHSSKLNSPTLNTISNPSKFNITKTNSKNNFNFQDYTEKDNIVESPFKQEDKSINNNSEDSFFIKQQQQNTQDNNYNNSSHNIGINIFTPEMEKIVKQSPTNNMILDSPIENSISQKDINLNTNKHPSLNLNIQNSSYNINIPNNNNNNQQTSSTNLLLTSTRIAPEQNLKMQLLKSQNLYKSNMFTDLMKSQMNLQTSQINLSTFEFGKQKKREFKKKKTQFYNKQSSQVSNTMLNVTPSITSTTNIFNCKKTSLFKNEEQVNDSKGSNTSLQIISEDDLIISTITEIGDVKNTPYNYQPKNNLKELQQATPILVCEKQKQKEKQQLIQLQIQQQQERNILKHQKLLYQQQQQQLKQLQLQENILSQQNEQYQNNDQRDQSDISSNDNDSVSQGIDKQYDIDLFTDDPLQSIEKYQYTEKSSSIKGKYSLKETKLPISNKIQSNYFDD